MRLFDQLLNKAVYSVYIVFAKLGLFYVKLVVKQPKPSGERKKVLFMPHYGEFVNGPHERISNWGEFLEENGIDYDVHWVWNIEYIKENFLSDNIFKKYKFYFSATWKRIKIAHTLKKYDALWIQRGFIPLFPFKHAYFEKVLQKHGNVIYDFYDADWTSNYDLVAETMKYGQKVTVANEFLKEFSLKCNPKTYLIPFCFPYKDYPIKQYGSLEKITVGWMGNPGNFQFVKAIVPQLKAVEEQLDNVEFLFLCREKAELDLKNYRYTSWGDPDFEYFEALSKIDVGINPLLHVDDKTKGKVSFKCLEYMALGIGFATSPHGIPGGLENNENCIIIDETNDWTAQLIKLLEDKSKIKNLGTQARHLLETEYDYAKNVHKLIAVFFEKAQNY